MYVRVASQCRWTTFPEQSRMAETIQSENATWTGFKIAAGSME